MSERILIVRTSSMGDLIHTLPAISDMARVYPGVPIDWVAEESFAEIPAWHPAVDQVIPVALRRWRKAWWSAPVRQERAAFVRRLRSQRYSAVIDLQGLLKSAVLVALRTRGEVHGLDWQSAREPMASLFYRHRHRVQPMQPAVVRYRTLAGLALNYKPHGDPDFHLERLRQPPPDIELADGSVWRASEQSGGYAMIMPSASRATKLWPEGNWQAVLARLDAEGLSPLLLAGNDDEHARARRLAAGVASAKVLPRMTLEQTAHLIAGARLMVGLDSGLTHLSAAFGRPTLGIYSTTPVVRTPLTGPGFCASLGDRGRAPTLAEVMAALEQALEQGEAGASLRACA